MTTTTSKNVGGKSKPAAAPAKKQKAPAAKKAPAAEPPAAEPSEPARKPGTVIIKGNGTIPVYGDGAMRRLPKGEPVAVSAAELAFLKRSKVDMA